VERAQHGDVDAYGELVRRYQGIATRTAYVITGTSADAEDAAQDAFTKAYFALDRFRSGAPPQGGGPASDRRPERRGRPPLG